MVIFMILLCYASLTGNIERFVKKIAYSYVYKIKYNEASLITNPFILITYTTGIGEIPIEITQFLTHHHHYLKGVIGSGNKNFGNNFAIASKKIAEQYHVPLLMTFELSGNTYDIQKFYQVIQQFNN